MPRSGRIRASIAFVVIFLAAVYSGSAAASFPGTNGRFLFSWINTSFEDDVPQLATASATGDDFHVVADCCAFPFLPAEQWRGDWSPSGRRFAYGEDYDDGGILATRRADATRRKRIWSTASFFRSPAWSPNARRIAVVRQFFPISRRADIYVVNRDGTNRIRLTRTVKMESGLDWSSQNRLVFVRRCDLFKMKPNGLRLRRLTHTDSCERWPDWSPDGMSLTFERRTGGVSQIWTMRRSGANQRLVAAAGHSPAWAPDGTVIAYVSSTDRAIHTIHPSGLGDALIGNPAGNGEKIYGLDWQPRAP
jgi:Tol biopolymer transport system component